VIVTPGIAATCLLEGLEALGDAASGSVIEMTLSSGPAAPYLGLGAGSVPRHRGASE
jgi:hypothetical protein